MFGFSENFSQHLKLLWDNFTSYDGEGNITSAATTKAIILIGKGMNNALWLWYKCSMHPYLVGDVQFWSPHLLQSTVALQKGQ